MDQPGPRPQATELIIERPERQPPLHRAAFGLVTLAFWGLWLYFMMPAVTLVGWAFGVSRFVDVMVVHKGARAVLDLLGWYLLVIALMSGALIGWATYNWARFGGSTRRSSASSPVAKEAVAGYLRLDCDSLDHWQRASRLQVHFDVRGRFIAVGLALSEAKPQDEGASLSPARAPEPV